jgi:TM2 domain
MQLVRNFFLFVMVFVLMLSMISAVPGTTSVSGSAVSGVPVDAGKIHTSDRKVQMGKMGGADLGWKEKLAIRLFGKKWNKARGSTEATGKSQVMALVLCLAVGIIGIHRLYLGYTWQGIVQILTLGACGIWTLVDLIRIISGDLKPKNSEYSTRL